MVRCYERFGAFMRAVLILIASLALSGPATAQTSQQVGQMQLYIQQLEGQVRTLTGENERLTHELTVLRAQMGQGAAPAGIPPAAAAGQPEAPLASADANLGAPPRSLGAVSPDEPLSAPDAPGAGGPIDLSALANGTATPPEVDQGYPMDSSGEPDALSVPSTPGTTTAAVAPTASLSGSPRDEYDLAYGYILTGDYGLAEQSFAAWLARFPRDAQAADAQFWLGESRFQQRKFREAASAFLSLYKAAPKSSKAPDALLKLGMSLAALGEKKAACATLAEVGHKYPGVSAALMGRVHEETGKAGCS
jgi:tol-pal system protein YbgF